MKNLRFGDLFCWFVIAGTFIGTLFFYEKLPDPVPTHFNIKGEADGWTPKPWGAFIGPFITVFMYLIFVVVPRISPKKFGMAEFSNVVQILKVISVLFGAFITVSIVSWAMGGRFISQEAIIGALGLLFIALGNYMGKLTKNFFIGIRTPWTLASDEVWSRTHRLGGWTFVIAGLAILVSAFFETMPAFIFSVLALAVLIPVAYSFILYRKLEGFANDSP